MKSQNCDLTRGKLAQRSGVNAETIRYYEKIDLMPEPQRSTAGYRIYQERHLQCLLFIRRCRELGFTLKNIRGLLNLVDGGEYTCAEVRDQTTSHLVDVQAKIRDLQRMQRTLKTMISACDGGLMPDCPIIDTLTAN
ncbi:MAG TPA: helix-turn-helix domain-containing protein [Nitrosomonas nitrosa]|nr:helix-turn-helix domain-containing protein [Nitrosomonas sp.]HNP51284.1 helix-turn-helix domain-containing protein [Nitrosomonas nitrosa]